AERSTSGQTRTILHRWPLNREYDAEARDFGENFPSSARAVAGDQGRRMATDDRRAARSDAIPAAATLTTVTPGDEHWNGRPVRSGPHDHPAAVHASSSRPGRCRRR